MIEPHRAEAILKEAAGILSASEPLGARLQRLMNWLREQFDSYHWVGIYWLEGDMLTLGPFAGPPTEHTRIRVGQGVCGTAVAEHANQIVEDVRQRENYLACNLETRSEIVVLIRNAKGVILGQIDVDGTEVGGFDSSDEAFLSALTEQIAQKMNES
ncbi:MAG: GAF domain-containing protein [Fimbriimonadia bacterium]|nr:GAF domain-containing protein [Fimbriimonadia bacterium]